MNLADPTDEAGVIFLNLTDQVFTFTDATGTQWHWNASAGMRLIQQTPRTPLEFWPSEHGIDLAHLRERYADLDEEYARTVDLSKPILFIPFEGGTSVLIDGWHRLYRAVSEGVDWLPCYELTSEEAEQVLVMKIPPQDLKVTPRPKLAPMDTKKGRRKP